MKWFFGFVFISLMGPPLLPAQNLIFKLEGGKKKIDLPFEYEGNFIIIDIVFNRVLPLRFLFATGAVILGAVIF